MELCNIKHYLCIDIVNPYINSPGSTDIMSECDKKTSAVSPYQGATSETAMLIQLMEADETTKNSKNTETGKTEVHHKRILIFFVGLTICVIHNNYH